jgi:hypothetical protein
VPFPNTTTFKITSLSLRRLWWRADCRRSIFVWRRIYRYWCYLNVILARTLEFCTCISKQKIRLALHFQRNFTTLTVCTHHGVWEFYVSTMNMRMRKGVCHEPKKFVDLYVTRVWVENGHSSCLSWIRNCQSMSTLETVTMNWTTTSYRWIGWVWEITGWISRLTKINDRYRRIHGIYLKSIKKPKDANMGPVGLENTRILTDNLQKSVN